MKHLQIPSLGTRGLVCPWQDVEPGRHALEKLQFFSSEKVILLLDLFRKLAPCCRSAQLADLTCLKAAHIIGCWSGHTPSVGQSQNLQGARNMLLVWPLLDSPLTRGPKLRPSSARMHLATDSVHAFAPSRRSQKRTSSETESTNHEKSNHEKSGILQRALEARAPASPNNVSEGHEVGLSQSVFVCCATRQ